ncbi:MAG: hypothetical protein Q9211_003942 [Gyalolechia sp. 1 TL-2023]
MALTSPMMPSPSSNLISAFSPYTDSPTSPAPFKSPIRSSTSSNDSNFLQPPVQSPRLSSPSDVTDPSPIASSSNGTDFEDTGLEPEGVKSKSEPPTSPRREPRQDPEATPSIRQGELTELKLDTKTAAVNNIRPRSDEDEQPTSVIHAPQGFEPFVGCREAVVVLSAHCLIAYSKVAPKHPSFHTDTFAAVRCYGNWPITYRRKRNRKAYRRGLDSPASPPPITTAAPPGRDWSSAPRADTRPETEAEALEDESKISRVSSLEDIPGAQDSERTGHQTSGQNNSEHIFDEAIGRFQNTTDEVAVLNLALGECWTLCNTLAGLSQIHREKSFSQTKEGDSKSQAWKSCWALCQKLYDTRDEDDTTQVMPTLDLCRDFCQCLFEVRLRENETADSVLRVSFELNNHLYNTHDRTLPEAFRERTLDFYVTLCHRLMKQRSKLMGDTDSLLRACWSLAEMLFSLRQNKRGGKPADEELLGSAVQACWELCDLFREGWTQVRPDRGTPRPSQTTFTQAFQQAKKTSIHKRAAKDPPYAYADLEESSDEGEFGRANPETPTTIFEDTQQMSPVESPVSNILVLGPDARSQPGRSQQNRRGVANQWSSTSSTLSGYSGSSTSTIIHPAEDPHLLCLKLLIVKAALNVGFQRSASVSLQSFVKSIPSNSFGNAPWQLQLLDQYKKLVASDPGFRSPGPAKAIQASEIAKAVQWMVGIGQYTWLADLFRLVFGFWVEDGERRMDVFIQT